MSQQNSPRDRQAGVPTDAPADVGPEVWSVFERFRLTGKTALITGSYRGLGLVLAEGLAQAGARVILNGRNREGLAQAADLFVARGYQTGFACFDIGEEDQVDAALSELEERYGGVDILVNNAGIQRRERLESVDLTTWRQILDTNLTGAFIVARRVAARMIRERRGKIINICSLASELGRQGIGPYSAAKGGLKMLTRAMCADWAAYNIQVNAIGPGFFLTELTQALADNRDFNAWLTARAPAGRWGEPRELVGALLLLASSAGDYINGHMIMVDGGVHAVM